MIAQRYNTGQTCDVVDDCFPEPPDFSCVDVCNPCASPCEEVCKPKTRIQDAICLSDNEYERCFSLHQYVGCEPVQVPATLYCIELQVRKRGACRVLTRECPIRADIYGNACFVWSCEFRDLPAGYYEADLFLNGKSCFTWLFRKRGCWANMKTESVELEQPDCSAPAQCCNGCVPTPDIETTTPMGDCEECDGNQCK